MYSTPTTDEVRKMTTSQTMKGHYKVSAKQKQAHQKEGESVSWIQCYAVKLISIANTRIWKIRTPASSN
jgi:hypothetical protein